LFGIISLTALAEPLWPILVASSFLATLIVVWAWFNGEHTTGDVLFVAILARILMLPMPPSLSDDGYRYVWDGMLQWQGINPFDYRPSDPALEALANHPVFVHLNSADYFSVYPPLSQLSFMIGGWLPAESWLWSFLLMKFVVVGAEIGALFLLARIVSSRNLVLYAWNPLVIIETAGQAHTETLLVALLIISLWAYGADRPRLSAVALSLSIWVKLYPIFLVPFLLRRVGWRFVWIPVVTSVLVIAPYFSPGAISNATESLRLYVEHFEFYSGTYLSLKWVLYKVGFARGFERVLGATLAATYILYLGGLYVLDARRNWKLSHVLFLAIAGYLAAATTIHPWYFVGILGLIVFKSRPTWSWFWLASISTGTYLLYSNGVYWPVVWIGWGGFLSLFAVEMGKPIYDMFLRQTMVSRARQKANIVRPYLDGGVQELDRPLSVLDLGAGEGYVGRELDRRNYAVTLCDIRESNQTELPFVAYDGTNLPFGDNWFDATILVFTLHHCEDHIAVIREARRVTAGRIVILESVFDSEADRRLLARLDTFANGVRGGGEGTQYQHFRKMDDWISLFEHEGFEVRSARRWGRIHKQALIVLEAR
jgi:alpha-1,6-mannosyltransferase